MIEFQDWLKLQRFRQDAVGDLAREQQKMILTKKKECLTNVHLMQMKLAMREFKTIEPEPSPVPPNSPRMR